MTNDYNEAQGNDSSAGNSGVYCTCAHIFYRGMKNEPFIRYNTSKPRAKEKTCNQ